jgi:hypothetical protein
MNDKRTLTGFGLLVAPLAAAWWLTRNSSPADTTSGLISLVVLAMFSPLYFSVPALVTQHARDRALGTVRNPMRAVLLVPHLIFNSSSPVRFETAMSVVGFAVATSMLWSHAWAGICAVW